MWYRHATLALAVGALALTGCGMMQAGSGQAASRAAGPDALFVAQAAHGSASEMELSRIALERAQSPAVKDYARMILDDHRKAAQQLDRLAQRDGFPIPTQPTDQIEEKTQELQYTSAASFDPDYLSRMVHDHLRTIEMFRQVATYGHDPDVRAWAKAQIPILEKHLQDARRLEGATTAASVAP